MAKKIQKKRVVHQKKKILFKFERKHLLWFLCVVGLILFIPGFLSRINKKDECANSISCIKDLSGKFDPTGTSGEFMGRPVAASESSSNYAVNQVLGENTSNKKIYIDLSAQHIYAKEGDSTVMDFPVSTGKWGLTPTGTFHIWIKLRYTRMVGGNPAIGTYYNLPNVPYTMYFYNDSTPKYKGFGIHGAYWHNNFGHPMSHGCVNMRNADVEKLYAWATPVVTGNTTFATDDNPGTEIVIYGTTPKE